MLGRQIADSSRSRSLDHRAHAETADTEVGQPQEPPVIEEDQVRRFDVAVYDAMLVRMRDRVEDLLRVLQGRLDGEPRLETLLECSPPERIDDHEDVGDEIGVLDRKDVRMIQPRVEPDLLAEVIQLFLRRLAEAGHLERDVNALDGIERAIDVRETTARDVAFNPILAEHPPGAELRQTRCGHTYPTS